MQLSTFYLWIKSLHIAFMVTWFAGLFYLPRLFIYHIEAEDQPGRRRFTVMEKRLFAIMTVGAALTAVFGLLLVWLNPALLSIGWFQVKLLLLAALIAYHLRCRRWIGLLEQQTEVGSSIGLRWFNEIPVIFLLGIICLAVLKPS